MKLLICYTFLQRISPFHKQGYGRGHHSPEECVNSIFCCTVLQNVMVMKLMAIRSSRFRMPFLKYENTVLRIDCHRVSLANVIVTFPAMSSQDFCNDIGHFSAERSLVLRKKVLSNVRRVRWRKCTLVT